jgi:hypothetical protein
LENARAGRMTSVSVTADKGYDDGANHLRLSRARGLHSAIRLGEWRTQKKDKNKDVRLALRATAEYQQGVKERYKIERKSGEAKQGHGSGRCRYLGLVRYAIQAFLTSLALNLKRMVKVLTGVNFKGRASAGGECAAESLSQADGEILTRPATRRHEHLSGPGPLQGAAIFQQESQLTLADVSLLPQTGFLPYPRLSFAGGSL